MLPGCQVGIDYDPGYENRLETGHRDRTDTGCMDRTDTGKLASYSGYGGSMVKGREQCTYL